MRFGPGGLSTFLYYFASTAVVFTLLSAQSIGVGLETGIPEQVGVVGGLVAGLMGTFYNRTVTLSLPVKNQTAFLAKLNEVLNRLGYQQQEAREDGVLVYQRSSFRKFLSGKVYVQIENKTATIASRSVHIKAIQRSLIRGKDGIG